MFNVGAIVESVRRHWVAIVIVFVLALGAGAASSFLKTGDQAKQISNTAYTAEAVIYFTVEEGDYDKVSSDANLLISDARRAVVSDAVAGEVRRTYGSDLQITSPWWNDTEKNARYYTHYVFVDVSAPTAELAVEAANAAATRATKVMESIMPVESAVVAEAAYVKQGDGTAAADRGTDELEQIESAVETSRSISPKKLLIFGFIGLFGAIFAFACVDILSRRVRSERDIERMLDLTVLGSAKSPEDFAPLTEGLSLLLSRNNLNSVAFAGACMGDNALVVAQEAKKTLRIPVACVESLSDGAGVSQLAESDSVVLVLSEGAATGAQIDRAMKMLRLADVPVAGAIFIPKKAK